MLHKKLLHPTLALILVLLNSFIFIEPFFFKAFLSLPKNCQFFCFFTCLLPLFFLALFNLKKILPCLKALIKLNSFILLVLFFMSFNKQGLDLLSLLIRFNLIMFFTLLLFYNEDLFYLSYALNKLPKFSFLLFFTLSFCKRLAGISKLKVQSLKLRSFKPKLKVSLKAYAYLIVGLIVETKDMAQNMELTLKLRGFKDKLPVFRLYTFKYKDAFFSLLAFLQGLTCLIYLT